MLFNPNKSNSRIINKSIYYLLTLINMFILFSCTPKQTSISVLQFNIWQEGTMVENGFEGIVDNIINVNPDMVTFSEIRNYNETDFITRLTNALKEKGHNYYGKSSTSTGIISKYSIVEQSVIYPLENDAGSIIKTQINVNGKALVLYSAHLDYRHYSCYLPRGYDGSTWQKIETPITDVDSILSQSRKSHRLNAIKTFLDDSKKEIEKGRIVIMGGDFNEPSHLDWTFETKDLWDHNGVVIEWEVSKSLYEHGFKDTYREKYPDVANYPGFTFPSDNPDVELSKLSWAPGSDERDRIDFIYYYPSNDISLSNSIVVGPTKSVFYGKRGEEEGKDEFLTPANTWPTDHKAVLSTFTIGRKD